MNIRKLRENKVRAAAILRKRGASIRQIAILLYGNDSESSQRRVAALISKARKKPELAKQGGTTTTTTFEPKNQNSGTTTPTATFEPENYNFLHKTTTFEPKKHTNSIQPQAGRVNRPEGDSTIAGEKIVDEEHKVQGIKHPETVEKGKAVTTVSNWYDEDEMARYLADECYEKAARCYAERDYEHSCRFLELVSRFLKLSQTARKEFDLEELWKVATELEESLRKEENE